MPGLYNLHIIDIHAEEASLSWLRRDSSVLRANFRLVDLVRLDERVEASVDGLRVAGDNGWNSLWCELEARGGSGGFFAAGVLAIESSDTAAFDGIIERADQAARLTEGEPHEPANDPWRGLVSA